VDFWSSFVDVIWWFLWAFAFIAYLFALFAIVTDLFRDKDLSGWAKAVWLVFMVFLPLVTALVYLVARGNGMAERSSTASRAAHQEAESYIRQVSGTPSPSDEIAKAKQLLDSSVITSEEFAHLKARALRAEQRELHTV
jgi:signal transduction histidine kinase